MKEYLEGRNLITKLQAKHDLLQKTLGESESGSCLPLLARLVCLLHQSAEHNCLGLLVQSGHVHVL